MWCWATFPGGHEGRTEKKEVMRSTRVSNEASSQPLEIFTVFDMSRTDIDFDFTAREEF